MDIRRVDGDADLAAVAEIISVTTPDEPMSLDLLHWQDKTYPGSVRFLATDEGRAIAAATVGRIFMHPPEYYAFWATVNVLPEARRHGIGTRLLGIVSSVAREAGKAWLHVPVSEARAEAVAFFVRRGFVLFERMKVVRLELAGRDAPTLTVPDGIVLTTLAERPDLVVGIHAVAQEAFQDIPGGDEPITAADLAEFRDRDVEPLPPWGFVVALEPVTDSVVGYASIYPRPDGSTTAWHDMTAVARAWRGRGLATALKSATIRAAMDHGMTALETGNDIDNAPMRAVNARLGYQPLPDALTMRGPTASPATPTGTVSDDA